MSHRTYQLTWHKPRMCWKKFYRGTRYYCPIKCRGKSDRDGYRKSLEWWLQKKADIDRAEFAAPLADLKSASKIKSHFDDVESLFAAYVDHKLSRVRSGLISVGTYDEIHRRVQTFRVFLDGLRASEGVSICSPADLDSQVFERYREVNLIQLRDKRISPVTHKKRLETILGLMRWAWTNEYIDSLPRNLDGKYPRPEKGIERPSPEFFPIGVIQQLFDASSQRTKLYIALALNCGWTAADIATLTHDMLDRKTGVLSRDRNKTGVPTSFRLWEITLSLLGTEMTPRSDGLMLLGQNGHPLIHQEILPDGKPMAQTSAIRLSFDRVRRKTGVLKGPGFKAFRKTSAQLIEQHFTTEPHLVDQFLGHAYGNRVREAYTTGSFGRIHEVCDWLGKQYDLTACVTGRPH